MASGAVGEAGGSSGVEEVLVAPMAEGDEDEEGPRQRSVRT